MMNKTAAMLLRLVNQMSPIQEQSTVAHLQPKVNIMMRLLTSSMVSKAYSISTLNTHSLSLSQTSKMYQITYQVPYPSAGLLEEWRIQSFPTLDEAKRMVDFYRSCGSPAKLISSK